jgi:Flp pilus assembly protein TadB
MAEGYDSEGLRIFSQTLIAKWDVGGDLAPVLLRVSRVMRDRLALKMRLRSELAGARLGALIVSVLPYLLLPVLLWRRPEWLRSLLEHPVGLQLLLAAILMQLLGVLWLRQILRSDLR